MPTPSNLSLRNPAQNLLQRMKKRRIFLVVCIAWTGVMALGSVCAAGRSIEPAHALPLGERLVYKISWLGIPVGVGELWVKERAQLDGREVIHIVGTIRTNKVLKTIFPMHDEAHSWIDAETFESVQFEKQVHELLIKAHERMVFDSSKQKGYFESFKTGVKNEFDITTPVQDAVSVVYWARRQALVPGASVKTVISCDQQQWAVEVNVVRREPVRLRGKKVDTLRLEPVTWVEGVERRGRAWINVTTDASQTPVRIGYKAPFGSVIGTLRITE